MRGSIYINELRPGHVIMDLSGSPQELLTKKTTYGFAYLKTLDRLGLEHAKIETGLTFRGLRVIGTVETIKERASDLQRHIGLIASGAVQTAYTAPWDRDVIGRTLDRLANRTIPEMAAEITLGQAVGLITEPFADMTNDDGVVIRLDQAAPWRVEAMDE